MATVTRILLAITAAALLSGCSDINYERTKTGKLAGKLILEWIDQDKFRFISDPEQPLQFVRANNQVIKPGSMYTDGGSIPAPLRAIKSFSPWGYAPAFIIHDWLFVMKQCKIPGFEKWDHLKAAEVMAEVMKTVMENPKFGGPNKLVHFSMYEAVRSDVAKDYWDNGKCETPSGRTRALRIPAGEPSSETRSILQKEGGGGGTEALDGARAAAPAENVRLRTVITF